MPTLEKDQLETAAPATAAPAPKKRVRPSRAKKKETPVEAPFAANATAPAPAPEAPVAVPEESEEEFSPALLFLEDFVVTALLSAGHALTSEQLAERAEGWVLPVAALENALANSRRVAFDGGQWNSAWHAARRSQSREERARSPIESLIRELLLAVGKPLPTPVIAREVGLMLNVYDPNLKKTVAGLIKTLRWAVEIAPGVYLHEDWMLRVGAPDDELLIKENRLSRDPDFQGLREFAEVTAKTPAAIARELLEFTGSPLNQKVIGFFVHRQAPVAFSPPALAAALNDRKQFQPLIDGFITLQEQLADLKTRTQEWLEELIAPATPEVSIAEAVAEAVGETVAQAPVADAISANGAPGAAPVDASNELAPVAQVTAQAPATEAPVAQAEVVPAPVAPSPAEIDLAARPEDVPPYVGVVPEPLLPVALQVIDPKTGEPFDFALDDAGLNDDAAKFVHDPQREDIGEEIEVAPVETKGEAPKSARIVMLNHHIRAGTVKIRDVDRAFFALDAPFVPLKLHDSEDDEDLEVWAARATGIIYALGQWFDENLPPSGGTMKFERTDKGIEISVDRPDAETFLTPRRLHELENLRAPAAKLSLFEIAAKLVEDHPAGMTLPALWAEVNVIRRTSKRLLASVLSGYGAFSLKEGRKGEMLWFYDQSGGGIKQEKRQFMRR